MAELGKHMLTRALEHDTVEEMLMCSIDLVNGGLQDFDDPAITIMLCSIEMHLVILSMRYEASPQAEGEAILAKLVELMDACNA